MKLSDVFAARASWTRKPQHDRIIDRLAAPIPKQRPYRKPRLRQFANKSRQRLASPRT